ncbi:MAG: hypothetical protein Q9174_002957 [Haloplaca sp. 1 TL-2023]
MDHINSLIRKWMPHQQPVAVDSNPKLHGVFDTINATLAASEPRVRLPEEFYDTKAREYMDRILMEEEYAGYGENEEYRTLGIGHMLGEVTKRMEMRVRATARAQGKRVSALGEVVTSQGGEGMKLGLFACHDSTLAATLAALGVLTGENARWPPYTSSLAIELFTDDDNKQKDRGEDQKIRGGAAAGFYVRLKYNNRFLQLPGCQEHGDHLRGRLDMCTFVSIFGPLDRISWW